MSSVMLAADSTAIENGYTTAKKRTSVLRRIQGLTAGLLFLGLRVPVYLVVLLFGALIAVAGMVLYVIRAVAHRLSRPAGAAAASALALICVSSPQRARADSIGDTAPVLSATSPLQQTTMVFSQQTNLYAFQTDGAGTLSISLKDWAFPVSLQQFTASIMSDDQVLGSWSEASNSGWVFDVPISSGGIFDAFVSAQAGPYAGLQFGAYSMTINFEPASTVPLPPALDLLIGGMGLLGAVTLIERISRRRNGDVISIA